MSKKVVPSVPSNEPTPLPIVHYLHEGRALCSRAGTPDTWPEHERWAAIPKVGEPDPPEVTCDECRGDRRRGYGAPTCAPRFFPWRDAYGREHADVPRCEGYTRPSGWSKHGSTCQRKGVVHRGTDRRELYYCLQHDPKKQDEKRVADLAPLLLELLGEGVELMPRTKKAAYWLRRAQGVLEKAEKREG